MNGPETELETCPARAQPPAPHRNRIFSLNAEVIGNRAYAADQHILRIHAPRLAADAEPGQFAHLQCDASLPMRRPLSIMDTGQAQGWVEFLFKVVGHGTGLLARKTPGDRLKVLGPIGRPFMGSGTPGKALLIGGGAGIPPMVLLARQLKAQQIKTPGLAPDTLVLMGSEVPFPFNLQKSGLTVPGLDSGVDYAIDRLEQWGIASRLASLQGYGHCYRGLVTDLAEQWLGSQTHEQQQLVRIYACGPTPMLKAVVALAGRHGLTSEICLEEYMACAVGGCAGCVVRIKTPTGPAMQRVCVDGPVFDGQSVLWP